MKRTFVAGIVSVVAVGLAVGILAAAEEAKKLSPPKCQNQAMDAAHVEKAQKLLNGGLQFLLDQREPDGAWSFGKGAMKPGITAMALKCLLEHPDFDRNSPAVKKAMEVLLSFRQKDGSICDAKQGMPAYTTAIAIMAMVASGDPQYGEAIRAGSDYLKGIQIQPGQESPDGGKIGEDNPKIGGVGYGTNGEPNLSVLGFVMDAWKDAGVKPEDEAMKRAVGFLTRLQNRSESNPAAWVKEGTEDGGFVYDMKTSKAVSDEKGRRSYGTMTYVGFKSMLYAGVGKNDPRVQAAYQWIRRFWRLDSNPNMPQLQSKEGLYYYYHVFAKGLRAWGVDEIPDIKSDVKHNWRNELVDAMAERVGADGSWVNKDAKRWEEGNPVLATIYAVMALEEAMGK
jgi:squalene-hopene/tetraprenyl-beta-curcumene cyclase